jgi:group I intron endonuclease
MDIYKITNLVNNKVYIGQSVRGVQQRFNRHINDAMTDRLDTHFARAIRKYGPKNFIVEVIDTAETQDELNRKEQYWIREYDSIRHGYNETDAIYKCGGNTYMSKTELELFSIGDRIRESKLGAKNPHSRKVKCRNEWTGEEFFFDTLKECQEFFGEKSHRFISARLNHNIGSLYLAEWNFAYQGEPYGELVERVNKRGCEVIVTDLETNERTIYPSVHMTSRELGIPRHLMDRRFRKNNSCIIGNYKIDILD